MILENLLGDGQAQSGSGLFAVTHEWFEQFFSDRAGNTRSVIRNSDLEVVLVFTKADYNLSRIPWHELTGIAQQIYESALYLLVIETGLAPALAKDRDIDAMKFGCAFT